jgi:hypothetical protein
MNEITAETEAMTSREWVDVVIRVISILTNCLLLYGYFSGHLQWV